MNDLFAKGGRRRLFLGERVRRLRRRLGLTQQRMAQRVGISVSYLSQIESDDRPMTEAVMAAFTRVFPLDWGDIEQGEGASFLGNLAEAALDPTVPAPALDQGQLQRLVDRSPAVAERLAALHAVYQRSQEQLRILNDVMDHGGAPSSLPWDEVRDWFHAEGNYVDPIDRAAEHLASELIEPSWSSMEARLRERFGVTLSRDLSLPGSLLRRFDPDSRRLAIDRAVPVETQLFLLAYQLMRLELAELIDDIAEGAQLLNQASRPLLAIGLSNYAAGAFLMPYERFRADARMLRHDIDALRHRFGVSFEQACHRLSTMQRRGASGIPMFFCRVDLAGNITKRHSATRLQFARFGGACPMWVVHEAVAIPDRVWVQLAETPDGVRYVAIAKGLVKPSASYARPSRRYAVTLGCEVGYAHEFIYADSLDLLSPGAATPIGTACRICPRVDCEQRAFPQVGRELVFDPDFRSVVPYQLR